ncbi:MAG: hypothetical protein AAF889_09570 [Cyanobacteria bacterium P01_D01_bin.73]
MTQRERIMARLQTMSDESLHEVENCLNFVAIKRTEEDGSPSSSLSNPCCSMGSLGGGDVSAALATRWDVLGRVRNAFKRIRGDRASTLMLYEAYKRSRPKLSLDRSQFHEILVEWSSPLVGCLGREEGATSDDDQFWLIAIPLPISS